MVILYEERYTGREKIYVFRVLEKGVNFEMPVHEKDFTPKNAVEYFNSLFRTVEEYENS